MKKIWLGNAALAALALVNAAQAAGVKDKQSSADPPLLASSSWTGFYAGLGLGFRTSRIDVTTNSGVLFGTPVDLTGVATGAPLNGTGFHARPYAGYNWQIAPRWVIGIEGDAGFGKQTTRLDGFAFGPGFLVTGQAADGLAVKSTWDASLRARFGVLLTPATLAYATVGAVWQQYDVTSTCGDAFNCGPRGFDFASKVVTNSANKAGWTVGGGLETALWGHWLARAEYRYADFGSAPFTIARTGLGDVLIDNIDVKMRTHTATFGLAYKFGDPVATENEGAFAMAAAPSTWTGLYAGLGLGARASRTDLTTTSETLTRVIFNTTFIDVTDLDGQATSRPFDATAFRGTPYIGFNWQFAPRWIAGIEADAGLASRTTVFGGISFAPASLRSAGLASDSLAVKTTWDASLHARFGVLLTPATLAYATVGAVWQQYYVTSTCVSAGDCGPRNFAPNVVANSANKAGWTVGGGLETSLWGNWLARAEYRYADLGTVPFTIARSSVRSIALVDNFDVKMRTHTVSFGLAYKFN